MASYMSQKKWEEHLWSNVIFPKAPSLVVQNWADIAFNQQMLGFTSMIHSKSSKGTCTIDKKRAIKFQHYQINVQRPHACVTCVYFPRVKFPFFCASCTDITDTHIWNGIAFQFSDQYPHSFCFQKNLGQIYVKTWVNPEIIVIAL